MVLQYVKDILGDYYDLPDKTSRSKLIPRISGTQLQH